MSENAKTTDLSKMTAKQLEDLIAEASGLAAKRKESEKEALREKILTEVKDAGFTINDIFPAHSGPGGSKMAKSKSTKSTLPAKYVHPENSELTWTGRGRMPNWLKEKQEAGEELSQYEVK
tara:strand:+ start:344 stop:706 length:363 start_codon:yes stop_codon:yes gene_type:complete